MLIKNLLYPTDFSECAQKALPFADEIAEKFGARVHVIHVLYDMVTYAEAVSGMSWYPAMYIDLEKIAAEQMEKIPKQFVHSKNLKLQVLRGNEYRGIIEYAKEERIDMIVMGTHGRGGISRMVLGSTTEQVMRHVSCPVLTVRCA